MLLMMTQKLFDKIILVELFCIYISCSCKKIFIVGINKVYLFIIILFSIVVKY